MSGFRQWAKEQLPLTESALKHCEELIADQRARVAERKEHHRPSKESELLLKNLEACRETYLRRIAILQRDLARSDYDPPTPYQPPPQLDPPPKLL